MKHFTLGLFIGVLCSILYIYFIQDTEKVYVSKLNTIDTTEVVIYERVVDTTYISKVDTILVEDSVEVVEEEFEVEGGNLSLSITTQSQSGLYREPSVHFNTLPMVRQRVTLKHSVGASMMVGKDFSAVYLNYRYQRKRIGFQSTIGISNNGMIYGVGVNYSL